MNAQSEVAVSVGSPADVDTLEPLWLTIHAQHAAVMPQLGPYVSDGRSWALRRKLYEEILAEPRSVLLLASDGEAVVGYALGYIMSSADRRWLDDTWSVDGQVAEVESLAVLPRYRQRGIGRRLLDELMSALGAEGADSFVVGAVPENEGAVLLYRRVGFAPTWLYLSRLHGGA